MPGQDVSRRLAHLFKNAIGRHQPYFCVCISWLQRWLTGYWLLRKMRIALSNSLHTTITAIAAASLLRQSCKTQQDTHGRTSFRLCHYRTGAGASPPRSTEPRRSFPAN